MSDFAATVAGLRRNAPLVANFARRELKTRYRRSVLGWAWSLLNPLSTVLIYSLVFSVFLRADPPPSANGGRSFALYLFAGLVVWLLFSGMITGSMGWLDGIGDLRRKVYFPPEAAIFGSAASLAVQSVIEATVLLIVLSVYGNAGWTFVFLPVVLLLVALFGLGLGFFVAVLNTRLRDVQHLVGIVLNAVFFLIPIVYPVDVIPERKYNLPLRRIIELNPVNQFVSAARDAVYHLEVPSPGRWLFMIVTSSVVFVTGWRFFSRRSMALSEEL